MTQLSEGQIREKQIHSRIKALRRAELETLAQDGVPTEALVGLLTQATIRGSERMTQATKDRLRDRVGKLRGLASQLDKLSRRIRQCVESDPFGGVQQPVFEEFSSKPAVPIDQRLARLGIEPWWKVYHASELAALESMARALREESRALGVYLRSKSQKVRGVEFILGWILFCNPHFCNWAALSRLFDEAFNANETAATYVIDTVSPDALRQAAKRLLQAQGDFCGYRFVPQEAS